MDVLWKICGNLKCLLSKVIFIHEKKTTADIGG